MRKYLWGAVAATALSMLLDSFFSEPVVDVTFTRIR